MNPQKLHRTIESVTALLAAGSHDALEELSHGMWLSAQEIREAVAAYGRTIVALPPEGYRGIDAIAVRDANPRRWSVNVSLYTSEEGHSDLTLQLTLIESSTDAYGVEVDGIRIL